MATAPAADKIHPEILAYLNWQQAWLDTARLEQIPPDTDWAECGMVAGRGWGKALALDTPLPTPTGWTTMGAVRDGDVLLDERGLPCQVVKAHEVLHDRPCYRVLFNDDTEIIADEDHLWRVLYPERIVTTFDLYVSLGVGDPVEYVDHRFVQSVEPVESVPVRCVTVDSPSALYLAGRAMVPTHNTRVGAEWLGRVTYEQGSPMLPSHVIAPTQNDARFVCFEGVTGLLNVIPPDLVTNYNSSDIIITLVNGATIRGFSAEKPARLRGPQAQFGWFDELAAWENAEATWDMAKMGMRLGPHPRILWTTTPRPTEIVRKLTAKRKRRIVISGTTFDNRANLPEDFFEELVQYDGTKIGRQELYGEIIDPEEAGIIKRSWFRLWPANKPLPEFTYIIMSLDTAFTEKTLDKVGDPDFSACTVWGTFRLKDGHWHVILLDCWAERLGFPDLIRRVRKELNVAYGDDQDNALIRPLLGGSKPLTSGRKPDIILIEDKGSGISLRQTLERENVPTYAYNPGRADKLSRLHMVSHVFARRMVWLPESAKFPGRPRTWVEPLLAQLCTFTGAGSIKHDDFVDASTQAIRLLIDKRLIDVVNVAKLRDNPPPPRVVPTNPYTA